MKPLRIDECSFCGEAFPTRKTMFETEPILIRFRKSVDMGERK